MKTINDMELNQVTGGSSLDQLIKKAKELFETAQDVYDAYTGGKKSDVTVVQNEDGTVSAYGSW